MANANDKYKVDYIIAAPERNADMIAGTKITEVIHDELKDLFTSIKCFKGAISLQIKEGTSHTKYPGSMWHMH